MASKVLLALIAVSALAAAQTQWAPSKPVEFIVTAGAGVGIDIFTRTVQSIIQKHNLLPQPVVV
jgi:putative tricarboxylic transport membrane protein